MLPLAVCSLVAHPLGVWGMEEEAFPVAFTFAFVLASVVSALASVAFPAAVPFSSTVCLPSTIGLTLAFIICFLLRLRLRVSDQSSRGCFADEFVVELAGLTFCLTCATSNLLVVNANRPTFRMVERAGAGDAVIGREEW